MTTEAIFQAGKESLTEEFLASVEEALEARELIKISVLKNCADDPLEMGRAIAEHTDSELVQVIGRKIVLYRQARNPKNRHIEI